MRGDLQQDRQTRPAPKYFICVHTDCVAGHTFIDAWLLAAGCIGQGKQAPLHPSMLRLKIAQHPLSRCFVLIIYSIVLHNCTSGGRQALSGL
jgi:hypothetical protein